MGAQLAGSAPDRNSTRAPSDTYTPDDCGDFARLAVLPQLEGGAVRMTFAELGERLVGWLQAFGEPVTLATDSLAWDWPWIHEIFGELGTWPDNLDRRPQILRQETEFNLAVEQAFSGGLRRHHSLDDAKANRLGWIAARGERPLGLSETEWWQGVVSNANRMAVDEEYRKLIAKDLS